MRAVPHLSRRNFCDGMLRVDGSRKNDVEIAHADPASALADIWRLHSPFGMGLA